jgi:hypothetical protein
MEVGRVSVHDEEFVNTLEKMVGLVGMVRK